MLKGKLIALFSSLLLFSGNLLHSQNYTLNDVLALTLMNNPQVNSYDYDIRAADAKTMQASFRPNPGFDVETENIGTPIFMQTTYMLNQPIEIGGKRQARIRLAKSEKDRIAFDYEVMKRDLYVETTRLFIDVLILQQKIAFLEKHLKVLENFSLVVDKRLDAGKASIIEGSNYIVTLNTARIDLIKAQNELKNAKSKLAAQWGDPYNDDYVVQGAIEWIPAIIPLCEMGELLEEHPQILRSQFEENLRAARVSLERSKAYPDVNVRGGPRYLEEARRWVWVVGVSLPLPVFDRNQGNIWESKDNLGKIEKEREAIWTKLLLELNTTYSNIQTVFSELNLLKNIILPSVQNAYEFSYKGYELARYNYLELLETERNYRTSKLRYLEALGEYHKELTVLQGLTGSKAIINQCE